MAIIQGPVQRKIRVICYVAAISVAIAGILHLMLAPGSLRFNFYQGVLFAVGGAVQIFWIIPMIRRWGSAWYSIGIAGNAAFFAIWLITRFPGNPITGRGNMRLDTTEIIIEPAQLAFMGLTLAILFIGHRRQKSVESRPDRENKVESSSVISKTQGNRQLMILGGIVIALILVSWFVLPSLMPRRGPGEGGPRRAGLGGPSGTTFRSSQLKNRTQFAYEPQVALPTPS